MNQQILILSGPVHSGKTTTIQDWTRKQKNIAGILTPVINGERLFESVENGELFEMSAMPGDPEILSVGRFHFSTAGFKKAIGILETAVEGSKSEVIVIDEIGPLELLQLKGFYEILLKILRNKMNNFVLLLVVRSQSFPGIQVLIRDHNYSFSTCDVTNFEEEINQMIRTFRIS